MDKYYLVLYILVYRLRLEKMQVKYAIVATYPVITPIFNIIETANSFFDLQHLEKLIPNTIDCRKEVKEILTTFFEYGITLDTND